MLTFAKLFRYMKENNVSQYSLIHEHHISSHQLYRLRHCNRNEHSNRKMQGIRVQTLDRLCKVLKCRPEDIMEEE